MAPRLRAAAVIGTVLGCLLVGCAASRDPDSADGPTDGSGGAAGTGPGTGPSSGTGSRGPSPSESGPTSPPSRASGSGPVTGESATAGPLLTATDLPAAPGGWRTLAPRTGGTERPFGACARFATTSIGAERVRTRSFSTTRDATSHGEVALAEQVATFPDETTARRAYAVLTAWHDDCATALRRDHLRGRASGQASARVSALHDVAVPTGQAAWYAVTYPASDAAGAASSAETHGLVVLDHRIAQVRMRTTPSARGDAPAATVSVLRAAARRLS